MTRELVGIVAELAQRVGLSEETVRRLRGTFPGVHLTYCSDDDVQGVEPVLRFPRMNVYLVDASDHCLRLSEDYDAATGLVLAEVVEDEP
jgi:hypothetical protein